MFTWELSIEVLRFFYLRFMSEKYKVIDSSQPNFITLTVVGWVDLFIRKEYGYVLDDSLNFCVKNKGLVVHAYVYMTNHIHLIVSSKGEDLNDIVRDFKKYTSRELVKTINDLAESRKVWMLKKFSFEAKRSGRASHYKLWQDGFHPVLLDTNKKIEERLRYLHYNPIDAGFVKNERDWVNSSYLAYEEESSILNVTIEMLW